MSDDLKIIWNKENVEEFSSGIIEPLMITFHIPIKEKVSHVVIFKVGIEFHIQVDGVDYGAIWREFDGEVEHWENHESHDDYHKDYYLPIEEKLEQLKKDLSG